MINLLAGLEKQSKTFIVFMGVVLIGIIGFIDYLTGNNFSFSVFYVLPIFLVTWFTNQQLGFLVSFASAIAWLIADIAASESHAFPLILFWNSFIRLAFFTIIAFLLSSLNNSLRLAHTDHLTAAINSRYFYELVQMEMNRARRNHHPFTITYIDLDNFKAVNDHFGHVVGNQVLIAFVDSVSRVVRKTDFIARLGGDEFAILFPETNQEAAQTIFSKIQNSFMEVAQRKNWSITFSVGVLTCNVIPPTIDELIRMADKLMYLAKSDGKNTVKYSTYDG